MGNVITDRDILVKYNREHGTNFYNIKQVQEHAASNAKLSDQPVMFGDDASILHQARQSQADAAKEYGDKKAQSTYVIKPALADAGKIAGAAALTLGIGAAGGAFGYWPSVTSKILFGADGIYNLLNKNGVRKTYNLAKKGNTWGAIKSGAGDALNLTMATPLMRLTGNALKYGTKATLAEDMLKFNIGKTSDITDYINRGVYKTLETKFQPVPKFSTPSGRTSLAFYERPSKLSEAERLGIPKGERNFKFSPQESQQRVSLFKIGLSGNQRSAITDDLFLNGIYLKTIVDDLPVAAKIDAHGLAKGNELELLENLLNNGISKEKILYTAPLGKGGVKNLGSGFGTSSSTAYTDGPFIITSNPGESLSEHGIKNVLINDVEHNNYNWKSVLDYLKNTYPNYNYIRYSEVPTWLKSYNKGNNSFQTFTDFLKNWTIPRLRTGEGPWLRKNGGKLKRI